MKYNFRKDIVDGEEFEDKVKDLLSNLPLTEGRTIKNNKTSAYDLCIVDDDLLVTTFEIKNDIMSESTGNVAIEYECRGKPSGINVTKAYWWVQGIMGEPFFIKTSELKSLCSVYIKRVTGGDKGSNTKMHLIPCYRFKERAMSFEQFKEKYGEK